MDYSELPGDIIKAASGLKSTWKNIFAMETRDGFFIFRPLTRGEYIDVVDLYSLEGENSEDIVFKKCVLYPETNLDSLFAGTVSSVANKILLTSGFGDPDAFLGLLSDNREKMELADSQVIVVLIKAFPHLTLEKINNLDIQQLTYYLALAEQVLDIKINFKEEQKIKSRSSGSVDFEAENKAATHNGGAAHAPGFK